MIGALIVTNIVQAIAFGFSRPANKAIITEVVEKEEIVTYNAHLELVLQVVSVSSPVFSFLVLQFASLYATLLLDALTFFICLCPSGIPSERRSPKFKKRNGSQEKIFFRTSRMDCTISGIRKKFSFSSWWLPVSISSLQLLSFYSHFPIGSTGSRALMRPS